MSIITIISDFGYTDHYVAAIKASIYKLNSNLNVVDISHNIKKYNISHAAHSIRNVYKDFPEGSIHIICVKASEKKERIVVVIINENYFIKLCDKFRSPHLWKKTKRKWRLRHTANKDGTDD